MPLSTRRLLGLVTLLLGLAMPLAASAQSLPGGSGSSDGSDTRKPGVLTDILDAIGSGSRLLIDAIQPGEDRDPVDNPRFNSLDSPRHSLMTFTNAMELVQRGYTEVGYERALKTLPEGSTRTQADTLHDILVRLQPISVSALPGTDQIERLGDTRFVFFPRGEEHAWVWSAVDTPPTERIVLEADESGDWRFVPSTMAGLETLYDQISSLPPQTSARQNDHYFLEVFSPIVEQTDLLDFGGFLAMMAVAVAAGLLSFRVSKRVAAKADHHEQWHLASAIRGVGRSGGLVLFAFLSTIAIGFLELGPVLSPLKYEIPRFVLLVAIVLFVLSLIDMTAEFTRERIEARGRGHYDRMVVTVARRALRVIVMLIIVIYILQNMLGVNVSAILFGFGVVGLALSLAAQDSVKNLFGAASIFINRPFVIGDWIVFKGEMGQHWGVVSDIELQATKVQVMSGDIVTIPNMLFISREVENLSARGFLRWEFDIAIPYRADTAELDRAMQALRDVLESEEVQRDSNGIDREEQPHVSFAGFSESWFSIKCYHFYFMGESKDAIQRDEDFGWFTYLDHCSLVNRKIVEVFGERDIEFAFPTRTIELVPQPPAPELQKDAA